jgi:DNA-binding MarR family transcriptional regulator
MGTPLGVTLFQTICVGKQLSTPEGGLGTPLTIFQSERHVNLTLMAATVEPLSPLEESLWRAVMRIVKALPRHLDSDLIRGAGLTASEYSMLMHLSEAANRELRMTDLANASGLSASRTTRLVDDLQFRGLVTKVASSTDARGNVARLTPRGMSKLRAAWSVHLASVRTRFFDHIDAAGIECVAEALLDVADQLEDSSPSGTRRTQAARS